MVSLHVSGWVPKVDQWLDLSLERLSSNATEASFLSVVRLLDAHLTLRTFFVGYSVTLADIGVWAALKQHALWATFTNAREPKDKLDHLLRCFLLSFFLALCDSAAATWQHIT